jgi:Phage tail tube protein
MRYLLGESVNLGVGVEATRGTAVAPAHWIPARTPTGVSPIVEKTAIRETRGTRFGSSGYEITHTRAEGDLEFNVRNASIGYLLKSLLGSVTSAVKAGETTVFKHIFNVLTNSPSNQSLTLALSQPGFQDYEYALALVSEMEISTPSDDVVQATASFVAATEAPKTPSYTPAFTSDDHLFRNHDVQIKVAANVAGLASATRICAKDFKMKISNNAKPQHCISLIAPDDILGMTYEITGNVKMDYSGAINHDRYTNNTTYAMEISMKNTSVSIGVASNPEIVITLPNVTVSDYKVDRPIDDIVTEEVGFSCNYSLADNSAITVAVVNEVATY